MKKTSLCISILRNFVFVVFIFAPIKAPEAKAAAPLFPILYYTIRYGGGIAKATVKIYNSPTIQGGLWGFTINDIVKADPHVPFVDPKGIQIPLTEIVWQEKIEKVLKTRVEEELRRIQEICKKSITQCKIEATKLAIPSNLTIELTNKI